MWVIFANKNKSDVYVLSRALRGVEKFSLHASGDWRRQFLTKELTEAWTPDGDRALQRWPRPEPDGGGMIHAMSIWVPDGYMRDVPDDTDPVGNVTWVPAPAPGHEVSFYVRLCQPHRGIVDIGDAKPIVGFSLPSGDAVFVFVRETSMAPETIPVIEQARVAALEANMIGADPQDPEFRTLRMFQHSVDDGGSPRVYDIAAIPSDQALFAAAEAAGTKVEGREPPLP